MQQTITLKMAGENDLAFIRGAYALLDREMTAMLPPFLNEPGAPDESHTDDYWLGLIHETGGFIVIAYCGGCPAGMAVVEHQSESACHLEDLIVSPEYRGWGFGKALVSEVMRIAKAKGYRLISLNVLTENRSAAGLYEKEGFMKIKTHMMREL